MTDTTISTRQRLLDLWEKCPECRTLGLDPPPSGAKPRVTQEMAFALARDAMEGYLLERRMNPMMGYDGAFYKVEIAHADFVGEIRSFVREDRTDALISAVEAVVENQNASD